MVDIVSPGESKGCVIEHVEVTREASMFTAIRNEYVSPGMYAHLRVRGQLMMSDTHHEKMTNYEIVHRAATEDVLWSLMNSKEFLFNH
jgi:hypothetical protein